MLYSPRPAIEDYVHSIERRWKRHKSQQTNRWTQRYTSGLCKCDLKEYLYELALLRDPTLKQWQLIDPNYVITTGFHCHFEKKDCLQESNQQLLSFSRSSQIGALPFFLVFDPHSVHMRRLVKIQPGIPFNRSRLKIPYFISIGSRTILQPTAKSMYRPPFQTVSSRYNTSPLPFRAEFRDTQIHQFRGGDGGL